MVPPHGPTRHPSLDVSTVSSLGRELMEKKRMMLSTASAALSDERSPRPDGGMKGSDEDSDNSSKVKAIKMSPIEDIKKEALSEEDLLKRKAQRRREQVRAASRRCRDRQRRETEELRVKVFQLEEFISLAMQSYETELRRQFGQIETLRRENEMLRQQMVCQPQVGIMSPTRDAIAPHSSPKPIVVAPVATTPQSEPEAEPADFTARAGEIVWDQARIRDVQATVHATTQTLIALTRSPVPAAVQNQAFGWSFDFWSDESRYYVKSHKFFRGINAHDLAMRFHYVDVAKYIATFPEVKEKTVLKDLGNHIRIVQTVKQLPGKPIAASVTYSFAAKDEDFHGERWIAGTISVGSPQHLNISLEDECNGYIFEDTTRTTPDGRQVKGCLVRGAGRYESKGKDMDVLMRELSKIFPSVVIRWEDLFINDYVSDDDADMEFDHDIEL
ncbi:hypothetical protein PINS_up000900 [Pythium insidiosum]|nr:hypothetical protein PINS_up000900 [Pythium insidiosum]